MATQRLIPGETPDPVVGALERKAIDIIVPVYKSVHLTTRYLNSLAHHIHEIASSDPRLFVISPDAHRMLESLDTTPVRGPHMAQDSVRWGPIRIHV